MTELFVKQKGARVLGALLFFDGLCKGIDEISGDILHLVDLKDAVGAT